MRFLFSSIFIQKSKRSHTMREPRLVYVGSPAAGEPLGQPASPCPCRFRASGLCCITVIFSKHRIFKLLPWGGRARPHSPGPHQALTRPSGTSAVSPGPPLHKDMVFLRHTQSAGTFPPSPAARGRVLRRSRLLKPTGLAKASPNGAHKGRAGTLLVPAPATGSVGPRPAARGTAQSDPTSVSFWVLRSSYFSCEECGWVSVGASNILWESRKNYQKSPQERLAVSAEGPAERLQCSGNGQRRQTPTRGRRPPRQGSLPN